ncbi:MAG: hypothetical protein KC501_29740 [Myxococcales bacterium]|nr:hypothetical protein [Myxococcales bacterium]
MSLPPTLARQRALLWSLAVVMIAVAVYWPATSVGFLADDVYQIALNDGVAGPRAPWALYSLYPDDPSATAEHMARGSLPWWTIPHFRFVQLRPLSSLLLALDHALRPHDAFVHHLCSLAWLAAALLTAHALLRRATTPVVAGLALLVFGLDETFGWTVAWIANRCAMVAAAFAFAALAVHLRRLDDPRPRLAWLEGGLWLLAFAAGEYALCGLAYALAFALVGRRDAWALRLRALVPVALAFLAFVLAYLAAGAGVSGASSYVDPIAHPGMFAAASLDRIPRMLGELWLALPAESDRLLMRYEGSLPYALMTGLAGIDGPAELVAGHARMVLLLLPLVLGPSWWLARRWLSPAERRAVAWMALGSLLALVPLAAILPSTRALALAALGPAAFFGSVGVAAARALRPWPSQWLPRLRAAALLPLALGLLWTNTAVDAAWARAQIAGIGSTGRSYARFLLGPGTAGLDLRGKHVVVIAAPGLVTGLHGQWMLHLWGRPAPATWHTLVMGDRRLVVRRFDERTLELSTLGRPLLDQPQETLFRPPDQPLALGDEIDVGSFRARIVHLHPSGGPDGVQLAFDRPLHDPSLVFLAAGPDGLEPFELPAPGRARALPPPELPGLDADATPPR